MKVRKIGGREWRTLERTTLAHDIYMSRHIVEGNLAGLRRGEGEELDALAMRMLRAVLASGQIFPLLGGLLIPNELADEQWSEEAAAETARFLAGVTDEEDKAQVQEALGPLLVGFFAAGMGFSRPFRTASSAAEGHPVSAGRAVAPRPPGSKTSANGTPLSAGWLATRSSGIRRFFAGR